MHYFDALGVKFGDLNDSDKHLNSGTKFSDGFFGLIIWAFSCFLNAFQAVSSLCSNKFSLGKGKIY